MRSQQKDMQFVLPLYEAFLSIIARCKVTLKENMYRLSLVVTPVFFNLVTRLLFATCRKSIHGTAIRDSFHAQDRPFIAAFWHYSIIYTIFLSKGIPWVCMVSASKDGEYIARILEYFCYKTVRGSKSGGGMKAFREMVVAVKSGLNAAIVADGSKGPARKVQAGALALASHTGAPIVPVAWAADKYIAFKSWDRTVLPKPFSRIDFFYGEPIYIPQGLANGELEEHRLDVENKLNRLYEKAWSVYGRNEH